MIAAGGVVPRRPVEHDRRLVLDNATAADLRLDVWENSICEDDALAYALDFDLIICCVDRPWPRAVLNGLAYSDLVPVIDGGIAKAGDPRANERGPDGLLDPDAIAETYFQLHRQPRSAWAWEIELRPLVENF